MSETAQTERYQPHDGDCCPCVERLREQNKASSDEWTKRTATMQSDLEGLRHLMVTAGRMNHERKSANGLVTGGLSVYGRACIATALMEADEAVAELDAIRQALHAERRRRIQLESMLAARPQRPRPSPAHNPRSPAAETDGGDGVKADLNEGA